MSAVASSKSEVPNSDFSGIWLHPVHQQLEPVAWQPGPGEFSGLARELALKDLATRAACGLELSITLKDAGQAVMKGSVCWMPAGARFDVALDKGGLRVSSASFESEHILNVGIPLLFADVAWAEVPPSARVCPTTRCTGKNMCPQFILAIAPRQGEQQGWRHEHECESKQGLHLQEVWLLGVCGDEADLQGWLVEFGCRGAIGWEVEKSYDLSLHMLGTGGFGGMVYQGQARAWPKQSEAGELHATRDVSAARQVAIKCLNDTTQFENEIGFLAQFRGHPNITNLLGTFCCREDSKDNQEADVAPTTQIRLIILMELCPLGDLLAFIQSKGSLPQDEALGMFSGVMSALVSLHFHRVVHRDVKAEHVLINNQGQAVLADLGTAACIDDPQAMQVNIGTPGFAAPEVVDGQPYGVKVDVFSTGVLLYFVLCNKLPFRGPGTRVVIRQTSRCRPKFGTSTFGHLSGALVTLLQTLLSKEPKRRPSSMRSFQACWNLLPAEMQNRFQAMRASYTLVSEQAELLVQQKHQDDYEGDLQWHLAETACEKFNSKAAESTASTERSLPSDLPLPLEKEIFDPKSCLELRRHLGTLQEMDNENATSKSLGHVAPGRLTALSSARGVAGDLGCGDEAKNNEPPGADRLRYVSFTRRAAGAANRLMSPFRRSRQSKEKIQPVERSPGAIQLAPSTASELYSPTQHHPAPAEGIRIPMQSFNGGMPTLQEGVKPVLPPSVPKPPGLWQRRRSDTVGASSKA